MIQNEKVPLIREAWKTDPLFFIDSHPHYPYVWTPIAEFYSMDNTQSFVATFYQTLKKGNIERLNNYFHLVPVQLINKTSAFLLHEHTVPVNWAEVKK